MAGKRFLNPLIKSSICVAGMAIMGLFLYPSLQQGTEWDTMFYLRVLVFLGFLYLLVQSVRQILGPSGNGDTLSAGSPRPGEPGHPENK
ncbi:MAG: hypothetical protein AB1646_04965 [Thermodesulfobacteriota bacterium]